MTNIDPHATNYMDIKVEDMTGNAYSNFVESIKSNETKRGYRRDLQQFLEKIPATNPKTNHLDKFT